MSNTRLLLVAVLAALLLLPAGSAPAAGPPVDYTKLEGLSDARHETRREIGPPPGLRRPGALHRDRAAAAARAASRSSSSRARTTGRSPTVTAPASCPAPRRRRQAARPHGLLRAARLRRGDDGPARHGPLAGLPRPPRPQGRPRPQAGRRVGRVARLVQRQGRHDRPLLRRLDADARRRAEPDGPRHDRAERRAWRRCTTTSSRAACPTGCSTSARWRPTSSSRSSASCRRSPTRAARPTRATTSATRWSRRASACRTRR